MFANQTFGLKHCKQTFHHNVFILLCLFLQTQHHSIPLVCLTCCFVGARYDLYSTWWRLARRNIIFFIVTRKATRLFSNKVYSIRKSPKHVYVCFPEHESTYCTASNSSVSRENSNVYEMHLSVCTFLHKNKIKTFLVQRNNYLPKWTYIVKM